VTGRLAGARRIVGTVRVTGRRGGRRCDSGTVRYVARAARGAAERRR
jgi:hypothetical protein